MKKVVFILMTLFLMIALNVNAETLSKEISKMTDEVIKAYKTKDTKLLTKYASTYLKMELSGNEKFWEKEESIQDVKEAEAWDGKIRGMHLQAMKMGKRKFNNVVVYLYDAPEKGEINYIQFTKIGDGNWFLSMMGGIETMSMEKFNKFGKELKDEITNEKNKKIDIKKEDNKKIENKKAKEEK